MQIPGGRLIDRIGARTVGLAALAVVAAGNALALTAPSLGLGLGARLLMGLGTGAGFVAGIDLVRAGRGGPFWQGAYGGSTMAAGGLALMIVPQLVGPLGWRAPYWTGLVLALAGALPVLAARRASGEAMRTMPEAPRRSVFRDRSLWPPAAVQMATFGLAVVAGNWVVTLLEREGHGRSVSGVVGGLVLFAGVVTRPAGGLAVRRLGSARGPLVAAASARLRRHSRSRRRPAALARRPRGARGRPRSGLPVRVRVRHDAAPAPGRPGGGGRLRQRLGGARDPRLHATRRASRSAARRRQDRVPRDRPRLGRRARRRAGGPAELRR